MKSEYDSLQTNYEGLSKEYEELTVEYEELRKEYDAVIGETAGIINEKDVEQALFKLVNQEREKSGLDEIIWVDNLYKWAMANSRDMATGRRYEYSEYGAWQEHYWATGYDTSDEMANAVFEIWKTSLQYERSFLNEGAKYGAVAVYKSGEIFHITYLADYFR